MITWATSGTSAVFVPRGWVGQRVVLRFDAATHRAEVWLGDTKVLEHEGGYTPFEADVTAIVQPGEEHRLSVVVNNELSWESIPPGVVEVMPNGARRQRQYHDFFNYAGLHRSVWLYTTPAARIDDLTVVTDIEEGVGIVRYRGAAVDEATAPCACDFATPRGSSWRRPREPMASCASPRQSCGDQGAAISTTSRSYWPTGTT